MELAAAGATASIAEEIDEGRLASARKVLQQVASEPGVPRPARAPVGRAGADVALSCEQP
jgi:hypothetical protein